MITIRLRTKIIEAAAKSANLTPEEFVAEIRSISSGRRVCAHLLRIEGEYSFFSCQ